MKFKRQLVAHFWLLWLMSAIGVTAWATPPTPKVAVLAPAAKTNAHIGGAASVAARARGSVGGANPKSLPSAK